MDLFGLGGGDLGNFAENLGEQLGSSLANALGKQLNTANKNLQPSRTEAKKASVMDEFETNPLYDTERGRAARAVAQSLRDEWWFKQTEKEEAEIIKTLYAMAEERRLAAEKRKLKEREKKERERKVIAEQQDIPDMRMGRPTHQARRISAFAGGERTARTRQQPQRIEQAAIKIDLRVNYSDDIRQVLEQAKKYLESPNICPKKPFKDNILKDSSRLSATTKKDYERGTKQVLTEMRECGCSTAWDMAGYLVETARSQSESTYKRKRALVLRAAENMKIGRLEDTIHALPPYAEMCKSLGRAPARRSTPITEARRAIQNERVFCRLVGHLSPAHADAIVALRYTGCRPSEAKSLRLTRESDFIRISIDTRKTGARKKKGDTVRTWTVSAASAEGLLLSQVLDRRGSHPVPYSADALRAAWRRARQHEGLAADSHWDLYSLRHQYASDYKRARGEELRTEYGKNWREDMFGTNWMNDDGYKNLYYGELAKRLGHTNTDMSKIYG